MSVPARIAIVTETYAPEINGVALTLARLVRGLRARGCDVSVVRPRQPGDPRTEPLGAMLVPGLPLPRYPGLRLGLPAARALRRRWRVHRPDVVYVATQGPFGWSAVRAARNLGVPVVSGFHTKFDAYAAHYGAGALTRAVTRYLRGFHNATAATLVPTPDLRERLIATGFANVHVLGRGVDSELFDPARRSAPLRRPVPGR